MTHDTGYRLATLIDALDADHRRLVQEVRDDSGTADRVEITGARALEDAGASDLVFCKRESPGIVEQVESCRARFVVCRPELPPLLADDARAGRVFILTPNPRLLMALLLQPFDRPWSVATQDRAVHPGAQIADGVHVGPGAVIGADVRIEAGCVIGPNTVIEHATIDRNTRIGGNCTIGGDGFGYEIDEASGEVIKFPHFGRIVIGRDVEIGSNTCIDRGSLRDTVIEDGAKVDNLVHVAHNCRVKRGAMVIANAMLGGSCTIEEFAWVAPSASVINGGSVGRCAMTGIGAVVTKPVDPNALVAGVPAKKLRDRFGPQCPLLEETKVTS